MNYEDFIRHYLGIMQHENFNSDTLKQLANCVDTTKDGFVCFFTCSFRCSRSVLRDVSQSSDTTLRSYWIIDALVIGVWKFDFESIFDLNSQVGTTELG